MLGSKCRGYREEFSCLCIQYQYLEFINLLLLFLYFLVKHFGLATGLVQFNLEVKGNLVPRVVRLFGQRVDAGRDSGELEFYYRRISAVKQSKPFTGQPIKKIKIFRVPQRLSWRPAPGRRA